jgi:hypothetical protein
MFYFIDDEVMAVTTIQSFWWFDLIHHYTFPRHGGGLGDRALTHDARRRCTACPSGVEKRFDETIDVVLWVGIVIVNLLFRIVVPFDRILTL